MYMVERPVYDRAGRLIEVHTARQEPPGSTSQPDGTELLSYAGDVLASVRVTSPAGNTHLVYSADDKTLDLEQLVERAVSGLAAAIERAVGTAAEDPEICLLAISYQPAGPPQPGAAVCTVARWDELAATYDMPYPLSPPEWREGWLEYQLDEKTQQAFNALERLAGRDETADIATRIARGVVTRLRSAPWASRPHTTDDFLVYACDLALDDLYRNLPDPLPARLAPFLE